jgi:hypothetical protein
MQYDKRLPVLLADCAKNGRTLFVPPAGYPAGTTFQQIKNPVRHVDLRRISYNPPFPYKEA